MSSHTNNEPLSALTHCIGAILSIIGLSLLIVVAARYGSALHIVSFTIFGATLILLYTMSTLYHFIYQKHVRAKRVFQILDHTAIYLLIAGTYTPVVLIALPSGWGWTMFGLVWGFAILGTIIKTTNLQIASWLSILLYLCMGWLIVLAFIPLTKSLPPEAVFWLVLGGVFYTIGALFFGLDTKAPGRRWLGMHEVFHIFVMLGSAAHFWMIYRYVVLL